MTLPPRPADPTPALTPQEWARMEVELGANKDKPEGWIAAQGIVAMQHDEIRVLDAVPGSFDTLGDDTLYFGTYTKKGVASRFGVELTPPMRHSVAALCLYQQPFGFSREDITTLLDVALYEEDNGTYPSSSPFNEETLARLHSLHARLAALLPPETPPHE